MGKYVLSVVAMLTLALVPAAPVGAAPSGVISHLDGVVTVNGTIAEIGLPVPGGATVITGSASVCEITWGGANIIQIQADTIAVLETGGLSPGVRLRRGSIAAVLNNIQATTRNTRFRVRTPSAVAGIRGTVFFVKVEDARNTYICACNGTVEVTRGPGRSEELSSMAHLARRFTRAGIRGRISEPGLLYHNDATMDGLARKIGFVIPWANGAYGGGGYGY